MRLIRVVGISLMATLTTSTMIAARAAAHQFEATGPLLLLAKATGLQVFKMLAGTLTCETLAGHGLVERFVEKTQKITVHYSGCVVEGVGHLTSKPDEPINAEYEFNAEGTVTIPKPISILAVLAGLKCVIGIPAQGPLSSTSYTNLGGKEMAFGINLSGLETTAKGVGCLEAYTVSKTGSSTGKFITQGEGPGSFFWV